MIVYGILFLIVCLFLSPEYYTFKTGVPTVASFPVVRRKIVEVLQRYHATDSSQKPYTIIDLGSGNGQLACKIARAMPAVHVIGLEISLLPWLISCCRQKLFGPANLEFRRVDFWAYDIAHADAIITFLTENIIERVSHKLRAELRQGALVVANETPLQGDWQPMERVAAGTFKVELFIYRQERSTAQPNP